MIKRPIGVEIYDDGIRQVSHDLVYPHKCKCGMRKAEGMKSGMVE
jgi:hypothetical protein